jgi:hypothetical protein
MVPNVPNINPPRRKPTIYLHGAHQLTVNSRCSSQNWKDGGCWFLLYRECEICILYEKKFAKSFFSNSNQYPKVATWKIWNQNMYYQVSCVFLHISEKKSTQSVCLVLTGVHVVNFFIWDNLGQIFFIQHTYDVSGITHVCSFNNIRLKIGQIQSFYYEKHIHAAYTYMYIAHITNTYYICKRWAE